MISCLFEWHRDYSIMGFHECEVYFVSTKFTNRKILLSCFAFLRVVVVVSLATVVVATHQSNRSFPVAASWECYASSTRRRRSNFGKGCSLTSLCVPYGMSAHKQVEFLAVIERRPRQRKHDNMTINITCCWPRFNIIRKCSIYWHLSK